jgi:hypothetical protein
MRFLSSLPLSLRLVLSLSFVFLLPMRALSHSETSTADIGLGSPTIEAASPFEGSLEFTEKLLDQAEYLLTEQDQAELARIREVLEIAEQEAKFTLDPEVVHQAELKRTTAEARLLRWVHNFPAPVLINAGSAHIDPATDYRQLEKDYGALILKIDSGAEGTPCFRSQNADLTAHAAVLSNMRVHYATGGITWTLLTLERIQTGQTVQVFDFIADGSEEEDAKPGAILIETFPLGRLKLRIVDQSGEETPAMVRLAALPETRLRRPEGAIDYSEQMDVPAIGRPSVSGAHRFNHSGPFGGSYWVVPDAIEMDLPAGIWEVQVRKGFEYIPCHRVFSVSREKVTDLTLGLDRWIDMPKQGWYSGDDHIHSRLLSQEDADRLMVWLEAEDLHVANILRMGDHLRTYYDQRGFGPEYRVGRGDRVLVPGQEDPRFFMGHSIGLNLTAPARDIEDYLDNTWVADTIHSQGGLYGHAHLANNLFDIERDLTLLISQGKSDFGEILQFNTLGTGHYYDFLNLGFKLTASAGSDVPYGSTLGENRVYAFLDDARFTADAWFAAMKRGRTFVTNGPMLDLRVEWARPGDEIEMRTDRPLRVRAQAWGYPQGSAPVELELIRFGEVIAAATAEAIPPELSREIGERTAGTVACPTGALEREGRCALELDLEVNPEEGFWIAARARGRDGSVAHTTPVYVRREGFRPWDAAKVPGLILDRRKTLASIEGILANLRSQQRMGMIGSSDFSSKRILQSATSVLETVAVVRDIYDGLEETLDAEREIRVKGMARFEVVQASSEEPLSARLTLLDPKGLEVPLPRFPPSGKDSVISGSATFELLPGRYSYRLAKGKVYPPSEGTFSVSREGVASATASLERIANREEAGWFDADLSSKVAPQEAEGLLELEGLRVAGSPLVAASSREIEGGDSEPRWLVGASEKDSLSGIVVLKPVPSSIPSAARIAPSTAGLEKEEWGHAESPESLGFPLALFEGKVSSLGVLNPRFGIDRLVDHQPGGPRRDFNRFPPPFGYAEWVQQIYFDSLNCGFRLPPGASSGFGETHNPLGYNRVSVHSEGEISWTGWWEAFSRGQCMITNGPLLDVRANDSLPGAVFEIPEAGTLEVVFRLELLSLVPVEKVELILNGKAVQSLTPEEFAEGGGLSPLLLSEPGWFLVRAWGTDEKTYHLAMTAPFYVEGKSARPVQTESAAGFVAQLEALIESETSRREENRDAGLIERARAAKEYFASLVPREETPADEGLSRTGELVAEPAAPPPATSEVEAASGEVGSSSP